MRRIALCFLLVAVLLAARPAVAVIGALDQVPAATLLLPYFEVDLDETVGSKTLFTVGNAGEAPVLAKVTLWTNLGMPTFSFNVYLPGRDVVEIDLRLALNGITPQTSSGINNTGNYSDPAVVFPSCTSAFLPPTRLSVDEVTALKEAHLGHSSALFGGRCGAYDEYGDNVARGYVTVDVCNACSALVPGNSGYFVAGGAGVASNANVLWGEFWYVDQMNSFAYGDQMVAIEADASLPGIDGRTFYARLTPSTPPQDNREGLPSYWEARFVNGGVFSGGTSLIVWRDPGVRQSFICSTMPTRLTQRAIGPFDEQENPYDLSPVEWGWPSPDADRFPWSAQRVGTASTHLPLPANFGWLFMDLALQTDPPTALDQACVTACIPTCQLTCYPQPTCQSNCQATCEASYACNPAVNGNGAFVLVTMEAQGRFAGAFRATPVKPEDASSLSGNFF